VHLIGKSNGWLVDELNYKSLRTVQQQIAKQRMSTLTNTTLKKSKEQTKEFRHISKMMQVSIKS
jgi:hypothetical protein